MGREVQEGGAICIPMADSCWYLTESSKKAILLQLKKQLIKKTETSSEATRMQLEIIILSEVSLKEKDKCHTVSLTNGI